MKMNAHRLLEAYRRMLVIRRFEETLAELFGKGQIGGTSHFCIGQEACAVGVVTVAARPTDWVVSNHRGHGHLLARGLDPVRVFAELLGRAAGYCGGRGGSQHMCSVPDHFLGTNGITAGGLPLAVGAAAALRYRETDEAVLVFFGDGAVSQGTFHESLNLAALRRLPILFACENNGYAMSMPMARTVAGGDIAARAAAYGMPGERVDGMDVCAVAESAHRLLDRARAGNGPALLEMTTYRFCGHSKNDALVYRTREEEADWRQHDCLVVTRQALSGAGVSDDRLNTMATEVTREVAAAAEKALSLPCAPPATALEGVYA